MRSLDDIAFTARDRAAVSSQSRQSEWTRLDACRQSSLLGYPIDATDHYGWCFGLFAPPTSTLYGTGDTCTACCAKR